MSTVSTTNETIKYLPVCPGVEKHKNRNSYPASQGLKYLWDCIEAFAQEHCKSACADCHGKGNPFTPLSFEDEMAICTMEPMQEERARSGMEKRKELYADAFFELHSALGELPDETFDAVYKQSNGDCPACAIVKAFHQFPVIASQSHPHPISEHRVTDIACYSEPMSAISWMEGHETKSCPCYHETRMYGEAEFSRTDEIEHLDALLELDVKSLPPMRPSKATPIISDVRCAKGILHFIQSELESVTQEVQPTPPTAAVPPVEITDDDLWDILQWRPSVNTWGLYDILPSSGWERWAKNGFLCKPSNDSPKVLCSVLQVALNCYQNVSKKMQIAYYFEDAGLREDRIKPLFDTWELLSGGHGWYDYDFILEESVRNGFLLKTEVNNRFEWNGTYYTLTFLGRKASRDLIGAPPEFVDAFDRLWSSDEPTQTQSPQRHTQSAARSDATGIGTGGKGGNATLNVNEGAVKVAPEINIAPAIEKDAIKIETNPTFNVPPPDLAGMRAHDAEIERIRQEHETKRLEMALAANQQLAAMPPAPKGGGKQGKAGRGRPSDTNKEFDDHHAAGWKRYSENGNSKQDYVDDNDDIPDVKTLNNLLDRHRKAEENARK